MRQSVFSMKIELSCPDMIQIQDIPYRLSLLQPFGTAHGIRRHTPAILSKLSMGAYVGYGEAAIPPYYSETIEQASSFVAQMRNKLMAISDVDEAIHILHSYEGNYAGKCVIDMALMDIKAQQHNQSLGALLGITADRPMQSVFTIGCDTLDKVLEKVKEASEYECLKIKLDGKNDIETLRQIRNISQHKLIVDANQAWTSAKEAMQRIEAFESLGVELVEQPFALGQWSELMKLRKDSPIAIYADEDVQNLEDIDLAIDHYDGINIKLMKCGGPSRAIQMFDRAKENDLKVMIGCMTESSCAISCGWNFAAAADYIDLDGNLLVANDPHQSLISDQKGRYIQYQGTGIGVAHPENWPPVG